MHMFSVDFFFHLAIAADLISRVRPEGKADNKVDIAYLYYLPFCMVFVSSDNLHKRVVPLFLRPDQSFVEGPDLKADLKRIDDYYTQLPKEQTDQGVYKFATSPPDGICPKVKISGISTSPSRGMMRKRQKATKKSRWTANPNRRPRKTTRR